MEILFEKNITQSFEKATTKEWIETNGLGGWASSTICCANTRGYHGMFVVATHPPVGRMVLVSKVEEKIVIDKKHQYDLSVNQFPNTICDQGLKYFSKFKKNIFPEFHYNIGEHIELVKTIVAIHEQNLVLITYEVKKATREFNFELQPFIAARDYHGLSKANSFINTSVVFGKGMLRLHPYEGVPPIYLHIKGSSFKYKPEWYLNFEYKEEQYRGLPFAEDLFSYGNFIVKLKEGSKITLAISTEKCNKLDTDALIQSEYNRRITLFEALPVKNDFTQTLALAADQFVVKRGDNLKTILAGYHWFSDWGRDTMIALPGICLINKKYDDAKKILRAFAGYMHKGIIPNRFPDHGQTPEYNTADATLWFFVALKKYVDYTHDEDFVTNELYSLLTESICWHETGTHYDIHVESDSLLFAGEYGVQLTWMDAKIGNWVVTPRMGKPVEINALWYNALMIMAEFARRKGNAHDNILYLDKAEKVKKSFQETFIIPGKGYLYDYVNIYERNEDIRPNQLIALSLPYEILDRDISLSVLKIVEEHLLTPYGLRSLNPDHYRYEGHYGGTPWSRDGAYHQGTVWAWLLGPYITAKMRLQGDAAQDDVERILQNINYHITDAGIGTISEIFDGDKPHYPKGCIAQAWSVAEILRAYVEDFLKIKN